MVIILGKQNIRVLLVCGTMELSQIFEYKRSGLEKDAFSRNYFLDSRRIEKSLNEGDSYFSKADWPDNNQFVEVILISWGKQEQQSGKIYEISWRYT